MAEDSVFGLVTKDHLWDWLVEKLGVNVLCCREQTLSILIQVHVDRRAVKTGYWSLLSLQVTRARPLKYFSCSQSKGYNKVIWPIIILLGQIVWKPAVLKGSSQWMIESKIGRSRTKMNISLWWKEEMSPSSIKIFWHYFCPAKSLCCCLCKKCCCCFEIKG